MGPRIALVANRGSGGGVAVGALAAELERQGAAVELFEGDEAPLAAASRPDRLVVAGGDGTIAPAAAAAAEAGLPLAVIPVGTANDFAGALGVPLDIGRACDLAVHGGRERRVDLGRMDGRPFVNVASAGLAVTAARRASSWKRTIGPLAYAVGAARAALTAAPLECRVACDRRELFSGRAWQVIVAGSGAFGGGSSVEVADPADGRLDATVIEARARARLAVHAFGLRFHRLVPQRGVRHARCSRVEVTVAEGTPFNVDGEVVEHGPATFTVEPAAVAVLTP